MQTQFTKKTILLLSILLSSMNAVFAETSSKEAHAKESYTEPSQKKSWFRRSPASKQPSKLQKDAFNDSLQSALPLTPEQILQLRREFNQTQAAMASHFDVPPRPVGNDPHYLDLSPKNTPMVIRLAKGYVTSLVFLDATNQPWPIESYTLGDPQSFNAQWDKKSHIILIQANTLYNDGNIAIRLKDLNVPIMLTLLPGQQAVNYSLELHVPKEGPLAKQFVGRNVPEHVSSDLLGVLKGVPPLNSKPLRITGAGPETQGWLSGKRFYLRTHLTILSPAWLSTVSSADETHAYELPRVSCVLGSYKGKTVQLKIEEY